MIMHLAGAGRTDVGRRRDFNEDAFTIDLGTGLLALADGMGGHAAGEVASRIAIETLAEFITATAMHGNINWPYGFDEHLSVSANRIRSAIRLANERIFRTIESHQEMKGMGTTVAAVLLSNGTACVAHIGDSRVYSIRAGSMTQVTSDHSWVNEQVRLGLLSREEAARHPFRNVITRALGSREEVVPDISEVRVAAGDRLLLCSDGLTSMLDDDEILAALDAFPDDLEAASQDLIERANDAGGEDNVTVILAGWRE